MPFRPSLALRCALLYPSGLAGCTGPENSGEAPAAVVDGSQSRTEQDDERRLLAEELIQRGEFEAARGVLDDLLLTDHLEKARECLAAGSPEDALIHLDSALESAPASQEVQILKADASLALAEKKIAEGGSAVIEGALTDALQYYRLAGESPQALFGAARAAWLLGRPDDSLDLARRGLARMREPGARRPELALLPERIHAQAAHARLVRARAEQDEGARALFLETEDALARLLGRAEDDPWAWSSLADVYESEGMLSDAKGVLERALRRLPEEPGLLERIARVTRELEGGQGAVLLLERAVESNPLLPAGHWHLALERFRLGLERYKEDPRVLEPETFSRAEAGFLRARELDPALAQGALSYEVVCRLARGWCRHHSGDLEGARREFLSMDELFERGIEWSLPGQLESGIQGLYFVADSYHAREDWLATGEVFETLHRLQPEVALWANNAGFNLREAGCDLEQEGQRLCRAARGAVKDERVLKELRAAAGIERALEGTPEERARLGRAANERFERARALMQRSWDSYRKAVEVAPEDVRIVNDAALVLVYYLHEQLDLAEEWLRRCLALGETQLADKEAELAREEAPERAAALDSEAEQLREAWGDAYQNLGVSLFVHRHDAAAALPLLERSVAIGPDRPEVVNSLLPLVRGERGLEEDDNWALERWARPCESR